MAPTRRAASSHEPSAIKRPPPDEERQEGDVHPSGGRRVVCLADVLELALETAHGVLDSARMQDVVLRAADKVRDLQAAGFRVEDKTDT
jgi:hypothetical protein